MSSSATILLIEDDAAIRRGVADALRFRGFTVLDAGHGDSGWELAQTAQFDLLLLDLTLPGMTGWEILEQFRDRFPLRPVIILTAKGDERDRVAGLRGGADDYVVKPFSVTELLARVEAVLRRSPTRTQVLGCAAIPTGQIDFDRREIRFSDGDRVELSEREAQLLNYLAAHGSRAISRDELLSAVWHLNPQGVNTRTIDMHIARLREKLRDSAATPQILVTIRGKGYSFRSSTSPLGATEEVQ